MLKHNVLYRKKNSSHENEIDVFNYYRPQRSWGKVKFSEACVKNSVAKGGCMAGGVWVAGEHVWQGGVCGRACVHGREGVCCRGACMSEGPAWHTVNTTRYSQ